MNAQAPGLRLRIGLLLAAALATASCGGRLMKLPSAPGGVAADGTQALSQATSTCRAVSSITSEIGVSGSAGGQRLRARLIAGLAPPASARLEATAFGQPIFILVTRDKTATLLLTRERRVLEGAEPAAVIEALTGVPLDAADLRETLVGCPGLASPDPSAVRAPGDDWRVVQDSLTTMYLRRESRSAPWRLVALVKRAAGQPEWRVEYRDFQNGLPQAIRLRSSDGRRFDLRLALSQVETNTPLPLAAFDVRIPPGTQPITLEELRRNGPLSAR